MNKFNINLLLFTVIIIFASCMAFMGCGDDGTAISQTTPTPVVKNGFSEYDFTENQSLYIEPHNVGITFLEPKDAKTIKDANNIEMPDNEGIGVDKIPVHIPEPNTYTYSIDPNDTTNTIESAVMKNSSGEEVFRLDKNNKTISIYLQAGNYNLFIYSGYTQAEESEANHRCVFLYSKVNVAGTGLNASYHQYDLDKLLSTKSCPGGNLFCANLSYANLTGANLSYAYLSYAYMYRANLTGADLSYAYLFHADLAYANLRNATLTGAFMPDGSVYP